MPKPVKQDAAPLRFTPVLRIQRECMLEAENSVCGSPGVGKCVTKAPPLPRVIRLQLNRFVEGFERVLMASRLQEGGTETDKTGWFRLLPDRKRYPLDRLIVLLCLQRQHTHQMQGICMGGIGRKCLLAGKSRVVIAAVHHVSAAGFAEIVRRAGGRFFRLSGRGPAFHVRTINPLRSGWIVDSRFTRKIRAQ